MRIYLSSLMVFFLLSNLCVPAVSYAVPKKDRANTSRMEQEVTTLINAYRAKKGLSKLKSLDYIASEARAHSKDMARQSVPFGHAGFDERMGRIQRRDTKTIAFAENVAYGHLDAEAVVNMWLHSAGHKKNISGKYSHTGVGIVSGKDNSLYFTQIFILKRE